MLPAPEAVTTCKTRLPAPGAGELLLNACATVKKRAVLPALKGYINTAKYQTTRVLVNPHKKSILLEETSQEFAKKNFCIEPLEIFRDFTDIKYYYRAFSLYKTGSGFRYQIFSKLAEKIPN